MRSTLTYADYVALPDDGRRYELHDGTLSVTPAPGRRHQRVVLRLAAALDAYVAARRLGEINIAPFDVILGDPSVVQPDIVFVAADRATAFSDRGFEGAPTLTIEVVSPRTARTDRTTKATLYARHGVPYYWIVDPDARAIDVHVLRDRSYGTRQRFMGNRLVDLPPFPGLTLSGNNLWP